MSPALAQREIALAGVALLAAIVALAVTSHGNGAKTKALLQPVTLDGGRWRTNLAGATPARYGRRTDCGVLLRQSSAKPDDDTNKWMAACDAARPRAVMTAQP